LDMAKVKDWLEGIPSPHTRKSYKNGIKKFEEFYGKGIETLIGSKDAGRVIEKYYAWLKDRGHPQNSCRNYINAPIQFLRYFDTEVKYRKSLGMYKTVVTTRDHRITIHEVQEMAKVADLREQVLLEVFLLGLRIGDVALLEWKKFDVSGETPIPIMIHTRKEDVVARTFISQEFKDLFDKYLETIDRSNVSLFQSSRRGHLSAKRIGAIFKDLGKRAGIKSHGLFRWHIGRKLFLRTCAELGINQWNAKMMCGKSVSKDIETYINGVELKNDFLKVSNVLRLRPKETSNQQNIKKDIDLLKMSHEELREGLQKTKKQLDKAMTLLETLGVTPDKIEKLVLKAKEARFPRQIGIPLENKEKLDKILKVVELLAKDSDEPMIKSLLKYMHRKKKEKSQKVLKDFLGESHD